MSKPVNALYEFDGFRLETSERELRHNGSAVPLTPKAFEILLLLVERSGHLVEKDDLLKQVWPDTFVEEANLARHIWMLRKALGDENRDHRYIETVPKRGYRFIPEAKCIPLDGVDVVVSRHVRARIVKSEEETLTNVAPESTLQTQTAAAATTRRRSRLMSFMALAIVVLAVIGVGAFALVETQKARTTAGARPVNSIAVLPFTHNGDPNLEYVSDGLTENVINRLSYASGMKVIARGSVYRYKDKQIDPKTVGRELGVQRILIGSVSQHDTSVSISAELIDTEDGTHVWGDRYDRKISDLQFLQRQLAQDISDHLRVKLAGEKPNSTQDIEAYQLYLKGQYFWNKRNRESIKKGLEYFEQAVARDQNYAAAYAGMADCYNVLSQIGELSPHEAMPKAKAAALNALRLDDSLAEAHASLALVSEVYDWDWTLAESEFKRAIELNANYATAHHWYAMQLSALGRHDEALTEIELAKLLDPVSLITNANEGWIYFCARKYDRAIEQLRKTIEMDPNFGNAHYKLALVYEAKGMRAEAVDEYLKNERLGGMYQAEADELGTAFAKSGWKGFCEKELTVLEASAKQSYVSPKYFVLTNLQLGNREAAFRWFDEAYKEHSELLLYLKVDPRFDTVRSDPRFDSLLRRVNLSA
ncbi:MAG TPA: winged helix-turn-helix domain-containing protein [Pyrinomonadaceae bacterium]